MTVSDQGRSIGRHDNPVRAVTRKITHYTFPPIYRRPLPCNLTIETKTMGMTDAFSFVADFSGMDGTHLLCITDVIHKAFVAVDEEGTEAAAATAVIVGTKSIAPMPEQFHADHPFLFLIRDNRTGSILFLGRVTDPKN